MAKRLLLFGPPGVGKGTHSKRLAADLGVPHVATGDMFREAAGRKTAVGLEVGGYMDRGVLVPDALVLAILEDRLARRDTVDGYLLDGFPRTVPQAEALARLMTMAGTRLDRILSLEAPEDTLVKRIAGRFTCEGCQASYNRFYLAPKVAGVCDRCGGRLFQRRDDAEATVRQRLTEYLARTAPVLQFFKTQDWPLRSIVSLGVVDEIYGRIRQAVEA